ncbi:glutamate-5-semialdehyde dehydrogenase [Magnetospirillum sp. 64-120]|uniref:glutamate-5-semialdehyde dehydrogenase n=1 Tax=Magnetospirillum sp. 64-120 TaxID=1895778 RepID=UPI000AB07472|nr:glutamate-5-semialdehyde dehydrogenase [Magnetospirillum sp. 64-120]
MMTTDIQTLMHDLGDRARAAARVLAQASDAAKKDALLTAAAEIRKHAPAIKAANAKDMEGGRAKGLTAALLDRLMLDDKRIEAMAKGLEEVAALPDPVGRVLSEWDRPNGLHIQRVSVPLGVIGIIYESRPNVTADAAALCLKSGNAAILRGGSESYHSAVAIMEALRTGIRVAGLPHDCVQMVPTTDRAAVGMMLSMDRHIDVIVPRGGKGLVARVKAESKVPLFQHLEGICHTYVDRAADLDMAKSVVLNAKMRRTGVCGSTETLLVDQAVAATHLAPLVTMLLDAGCEVRGDAATQAVDSRVVAASDADWDTEYLDSIISVKLVQGVTGAVEHINRHSSQHTECVITNDAATAEAFMNGCDSAIVCWNASTQFADGGEFGMGAEIGISTGRMHARGPVGVEQLCTFKYKVLGSGQTRPG